MRRSFNFTRTIGRKNVILAVVALVLIVITTVSVSFSWIEEVSQVEFNSNSGQETPAKIGSKILKSDAIMKKGATESTVSANTISLNDYFYSAGDMHLSPCYSNGEDFYFPIEKKNLSSDSTTFRKGTKDDANVNYMSATFRIRSDGANTAYWFEKTGSTNFLTFKKGTSSASDSTLQSMLRVSITVDGATNVYALNSGGTYRTVSSVAATSTTENTGRAISAYTYCNEQFSSNGLSNTSANAALSNHDSSGNLNGNTLFTVSKYDSSTPSTIKTVTVKLWLECKSATLASNVSSVDVASVNLNLVSSWEKTRRIYVKDSTVYLEGYNSAKWLKTANGKLFWSLKDDIDTYWEAGASSSYTITSGNDTYYWVNVPAVYNNTDVVLSRNNSWANAKAKRQTPNDTWNEWNTTFPNTFHSETYTVYSEDFATWEDASKVHSVYIINSGGDVGFNKLCNYMWDSNSVHGSGINDKVVKNAEWPGIELKSKMKTKTNSQGYYAYPFFFNSDYDRVVFNNGDLVEGKNQENQTQDLHLTSTQYGKTFDFATLTWYSTSPGASDWNSDIPTYAGSNTYVYGNFKTNNQWDHYRLAWGGEFSSRSGDAMNGTTANNMIAKVYVKSAGDFEFVVRYNGTVYKTYPENVNLYAGNNITLYPEGGNNTSNVYAKNLSAKTIYRFYVVPGNNSIQVSLASGEAHNN